MKFISLTGSTVCNGCGYISFSKFRIIKRIVSTYFTFERNWDGNAFPFCPSIPGTLIYSIVALICFSGLNISVSLFRRSSGTLIIPLSASVFCLYESSPDLCDNNVSNNVDFPEKGSPTIPICIYDLPSHFFKMVILYILQKKSETRKFRFILYLYNNYYYIRSIFLHFYPDCNIFPYYRQSRFFLLFHRTHIFLNQKILY